MQNMKTSESRPRPPPPTAPTAVQCTEWPTSKRERTNTVVYWSGGRRGGLCACAAVAQINMEAVNLRKHLDRKRQTRIDVSDRSADRNGPSINIDAARRAAPAHRIKHWLLRWRRAAWRSLPARRGTSADLLSLPCAPVRSSSARSPFLPRHYYIYYYDIRRMRTSRFFFLWRGQFCLKRTPFLRPFSNLHRAGWNILIKKCIRLSWNARFLLYGLLRKGERCW